MLWKLLMGVAAGLNVYMGPTMPVYVFPYLEGVVDHCFEDMSLAMHTGKIVCKCDDDVVPVIELRNQNYTVFYASVVLAENGADLEAPINRTCTCEDPEKKGVISPVVLLPVNSDFFILNTRDGPKTPNVMFAKQKPTPEVLFNLVKTLDVLKDKPGAVACSTETTDDKSNTGTANDLKQLFQAKNE